MDVWALNAMNGLTTVCNPCNTGALVDSVPTKKLLIFFSMSSPIDIDEDSVINLKSDFSKNSVLKLVDNGNQEYLLRDIAPPDIPFYFEVDVQR
jgi:hypothetical protein